MSSSDMSERHEQGLSNERTALAWQRTALSLAAGAAVVGRLTVGRLGAATVVLAVVVFLLCAWVFAESRRRYAHEDERPGRRRSDGRAVLAVTIASCVIAMAEGAAVLAR